MIRIVLDTNVFVSSFFGGNPRKLISLWEAGEVSLCLSKPIIDEYVEVLQGLGLQDEKQLGELLGLFATGIHVIFTARTPGLSVVADDPDDDKFIECGVALKADYIVSGDKALLAVENYMGIGVFNPKKILAIYKRKRANKANTTRKHA